MPVIAVVNRKGGSGKSTLAMHVAVWLAQRGDKVMLGDVDRQRCTVPWLRRRAAHAVAGEPLHGWVADLRNVLRPPAGVRHAVLDTPGGLRGFDLGRLLMYADVVLVPLCDSPFDREAAAGCIEELRAHPRVSGGRVRVAAVGMRLPAAAEGDAALRHWACGLGVPLVATVRDSRAYVTSAEHGLTVFDLADDATRGERADWRGLGQWLDEAFAAIPAATAAVHAANPAAPAAPAAVRAAARAARGPGGSVAPVALDTAAAAPSSAPAEPTAAPPRAEPATQIPISLAHARSRPAQALGEVRRWLARLLPHPARIGTGP